jgi:hypothetical protein
MASRKGHDSRRLPAVNSVGFEDVFDAAMEITKQRRRAMKKLRRAVRARKTAEILAAAKGVVETYGTSASSSSSASAS